MNVRLESTARVQRVGKRDVEEVSKERLAGGEKVVWCVWLCGVGVGVGVGVERIRTWTRTGKDKRNIGIWLFQDVGHRPDLTSLLEC